MPTADGGKDKKGCPRSDSSSQLLPNMDCVAAAAAADDAVNVALPASQRTHISRFAKLDRADGQRNF